MNKNYRLWNNIIGWMVFALATITYFASMQQTVSWWDCGEYISTTYKLEVSHPPGAPTFQILGRLFSLAALGDVTKVAMMINAMSALCSSFTILFLFWSLTILAKKVVTKKREMQRGDLLAVFGTGIVGALAYTFTDTFWFSAVEGEVYAMSSLCTAIVFWMILRWDEEADQPYALRWIILIAYIVGLSIGVHLLNLLTIPALAYVIYYKKYKTVSWKGLIFTGIISVVLLALILFILIPWTVELAGRFELFFVNSIGLPFNSGLIIYFVLLFGIIGWAIWFTQKRRHSLANTIILCLTFLLIGYSSFFTIAIRANTNTPINMNAPSDALSFLSYLNRDQYGSKPIVYGNYYSSPSAGYEEGSPNYIKDTLHQKYTVSGHGNPKEKFISGSETIFPRMYSNNTAQYPYHQPEYERWGEVKGTRINYNDPYSGERKSYIKPTFGENLHYFFTYQCGHMYWRYLMWNFSGRQNDEQGHGYADSGNWITGFDFLDQGKVGTQENLPPSMQSEAHNVYYMLPFLLGLAGFFFYMKKDRRNSWVVFLLFFMTGLAITLYLNDAPRQPRERDYAYAGSFYAFSIWIGMGVLALYYGIKKVLPPQVGAIAATLIGLLIPSLLLAQNWDDHDRSDNFAAHDNGADYLNSCPPNAILYTNGDNDTYSLWYAQEVEGIRTDVRVINWGLSGGAWYCHQQLRKINNSEKLPLTLGYDDYQKGVNDQVIILSQNNIKEISVKEAIPFIKNRNNWRVTRSGEKIAWLPSSTMYIPVDSATVVQSGLITPAEAQRLQKRITFTKSNSYMFKNELLFLDLLATNNWERPICFTSPFTVKSLIPNIEQYCHQTGLVYQFLPLVSPTFQKNWNCGIRIDSSYSFFLNEFKNGNITGKDVYVDYTTVLNYSSHLRSMQILAQAHTMVGDSTRAIEIMDFWQTQFPRQKFPFTGYTVLCSEIYFKAGAEEKGATFMNQCWKDLTDELNYMTSQSEIIRTAYSSKIQENLSLISLLQRVATTYHQETLQQEIETYMQDYQQNNPNILQ
ncbi:MAG: DUF2723 domain-containing protein [Bacteroidales bacterium]|nr:DUF2723 domain-containing protein [Bacteroidales bacterium]